MPSPSTPRRTSNRRGTKKTPPAPKTVDVAKPLGPYDSNSVRDRIRQWQSQGGGVVIAPEAYVEVEEEEKKPIPKSQTPKHRDKTRVSKDEGSTKELKTPESHNTRAGRLEKKIEIGDQERHRSGSAPKKRVVSDAHWRKDRSPPRSTTPGRPVKEPHTTATPDDDGIRVRPIRDGKTESRREKSRTVLDDGIRVRPIPDERTKSTIGERRKAHSKRTSIEDTDLPRTRHKPSRSRRKSDDTRGSANEDQDYSVNRTDENSRSPETRISPSNKSRRASHQSEESTTENSPRGNSTAALDETRAPRNSQRKDIIPPKSPRSPHDGLTASRVGRDILSQVFGDTRKVFARSEPTIVTSPRIPSIEAWLSETPDPFIDGDEPLVEIPAPLKSTSRRKKEAETFTVIPEDPNKIWEALGTKARCTGSPQSPKERQARGGSLVEEYSHSHDLGPELHQEGRLSDPVSRSKTLDKPQLVEQSTPSPILRRRGARRGSLSPTKDGRRTSPLKETFTPEENASTVSSVRTSSSVEPLDPFKPLRSPGLNIRRPFPSTGLHRLSTIASVETFNTNTHPAAAHLMPQVSELSEGRAESNNGIEDAQSEARDYFDPNGLARRTSKTRLAKHSDLISVLSQPIGRSKSIQSARSIRTNRSRLSNATIEDLMRELASDESKYMRELRTLVDGVIPVLLSCVLSKSDSAVAAGLFSPNINGKTDPHVTKPIIDMGIALERLKSTHKRIQVQDTAALLSWARSAQKVYSEYIKAWRMGFQDVVVNLAPAPDASADDLEDEGLLPRNKNGDIIDTNGERVDVAYLLKRPLVRLKYLAKTLRGINFVKPSAEAENLAITYQNLVVDARHRSNAERARLEDEAAASIDPTRARDPRTLCPLAEVTIDPTRRVRARDHFNLTLHHTNGQMIDCRVELLLRDNASDKEIGGDLLICEVDGTGRWLLFPPVQLDRVSARNGEVEKEIVVMVRGNHSSGEEWKEMLELRGDDEQTGFEWVQMLGLVPIPPKIVRSQSFIEKRERSKSLPPPPTLGSESSASQSKLNKSRTPSPREVDIPIGEPASITAKTWKGSAELRDTKPLPASPVARNRLQKKLPFLPQATSTDLSPTLSSDNSSRPAQQEGSSSKPSRLTRTPRTLNEALHLSGRSGTGLQRTRERRKSRQVDETSGPGVDILKDDLQRPSFQSLELPRAPSPLTEPSSPASPQSPSIKPDASTKSRPVRPSHHRSRSSVPSLELPVIPKVRKDSPPPTPSYEPIEEPEWPKEPAVSDVPPPTPSKLGKVFPEETLPLVETPPPPPVHRTLSPTPSPSPSPSPGAPTPDLSPKMTRNLQRRSSSPLKHEYEPSTASELSSDSDSSTVEHNDATSVSDSSEDEELEDGDAHTPLVPLAALQRRTKVSPQPSVYSGSNGTITPSQSASQAPFKRVPAQPSKATKTIASIFFWSDKNSWETIHPDECSIIVTPGLIEAFEMSAAHSQSAKFESSSQGDLDTTSNHSRPSSTSPPSSSQSARPLIALELTPLVPIRRGTALDISIRSPPTAESKLTHLSNNNIMFRSRNPEECEALYALINYSRINNPTYIALQNARVTSSFNPSFDRSNSTRGTSRRSSWFGLGQSSRSSYRASSAPTPSISMSDSSIGSMSSAFSALKRFGLGGSRFSIARSTVTSRTGSRANSVYTSSDNSSGSGASTPFPLGSNPDDSKIPPGGPIGLSNAKIRLYIRETASKWRDLGSARLTIMRPTNAGHPPLLAGQQPQKGANDKRIVVIGKAKGETLLDVTLGESCFERVARTGIAVSVWEAFEGGLVAKEGGVVGGRLRVFMIQMKGEAETAYTFSIVGKLRY